MTKRAEDLGTNAGIVEDMYREYARQPESVSAGAIQHLQSAMGTGQSEMKCK